jgi:penicillin amidase
LAQNNGTRDLGRILMAWGVNDDTDQAGPTIFQTVYRHFAMAVFEDELSAEKAMILLGSWYFWQERLQQMVLKGESPFFDDTRTPEKTETMADLFIRAADQARQELEPVLGKDPVQWLWGRVHFLELVNPLARSGRAKPLLGTGPMPMGGSGETLYRGWYDYDTPYEVTHCASLRLVADLGDPEKLMAVLPGGVAGRTFHPRQKDQVKDFMEGAVRYWWFSDAAIEKNAKKVLTLVPG